MFIYLKSHSSLHDGQADGPADLQSLECPKRLQPWLCALVSLSIAGWSLSSISMERVNQEGRSDRNCAQNIVLETTSLQSTRMQKYGTYSTVEENLISAFISQDQFRASWPRPMKVRTMT